MRVLEKWKDLPRFSSQDEEIEFWSQTTLDPRLMHGSMLNDNRDSTTITLRFDPRMLARIKRLARSRYLNYQSMIKQWLSERMEKEIQ